MDAWKYARALVEGRYKTKDGVTRYVTLQMPPKDVQDILDAAVRRKRGGKELADALKERGSPPRTKNSFRLAMNDRAHSAWVEPTLQLVTLRQLMETTAVSPALQAATTQIATRAASQLVDPCPSEQTIVSQVLTEARLSNLPAVVRQQVSQLEWGLALVQQACRIITMAAVVACAFAIYQATRSLNRGAARVAGTVSSLYETTIGRAECGIRWKTLDLQICDKLQTMAMQDTQYWKMAAEAILKHCTRYPGSSERGEYHKIPVSARDPTDFKWPQTLYWEQPDPYIYICAGLFVAGGLAAWMKHTLELKAKKQQLQNGTIRVTM